MPVIRKLKRRRNEFVRNLSAGDSGDQVGKPHGTVFLNEIGKREELVNKVTLAKRLSHKFKKKLNGK